MPWLVSVVEPGVSIGGAADHHLWENMYFDQWLGVRTRSL